MESSAQPKTIAKDQESDEEFTIEVVKDMSKEQENDLVSFLKKVSRACDQDSSVPDFVAPQVNEWLKELAEKGTLEPEHKE